jgi:3-deoxy-7-phosphoheptulonate synthase
LPDRQPSQLSQVRNLRIVRGERLTSPGDLLADVAENDAQVDVILRGRADVKAILDRADDRLLVIVGPCSVHDVDAALDYAKRLHAKAAELDDDLVIAMRVYFEKPRTTVGWKGLINDPDMDESNRVNAGLRTARLLLLELLSVGLPVACEFLDPITPQYISDLVSWGAIGARTTESQIHRQLASGLSMPIGFKNGTSGDVAIAFDAVRAAAAPHAFAGIDDAGEAATMHTLGNEDCHVILRGGRGAPNYNAAAVDAVLATLRAAGLPQRVIVDASHDNSGKDHTRQPAVAADIATQIADGNAAIVGVMLESFIVAGRQEFVPGQPLVYGQSITDACMDWDTSAQVLDRLAQAVSARRAGAPTTAMH